MHIRQTHETQSASASPLTVIVDDDEAVLESTSMLLEAAGYTVIRMQSGVELLAKGVPPGTSCLLLDVRLADEPDGVSVLEELRRRGNRTPVVMVTGYGDVPLAIRAMRSGAADMIEKPFSQSQMISAIESARATGAAEAQAAALVHGLTRRERQVLKLLAEGSPNKLVAYQLGLSPRTVEVYRAKIMDKLRVSSLAEAVQIALRAGLEQIDLNEA